MTTNPWDAVIAASGKVTDAVNQFVAAVKAAAPPPVVPVTSPDRTIVLATTSAVITDAAGNTWGITPTTQQVWINGAPDPTTSGVVSLAYVKGLVWQQNISSDWYSKAAPGAAWSTATKVSPIGPVVGAGPTAPPQAVKAGYSTVVLFEDFLGPGAISSSPGVIASFYTRNPYGQAPLTAAQYTIANSCLTFAADNSGFGWGFGSTNAPAGSVPISTPSNHVANTGNGRGFQYGYYEFRIAFDRLKLASGRWWPAVWLTGDCFGGNYIEIDVAEFQNTPNGAPYSSVHDWLAPGQPNIRSPVAGASPNISNVSFATPTTVNNFGMLWEPTGITFYWNGVAGPKVATTTPIALDNGATSPDIIRSANTSHCQVVIGTGNGVPLSVDSVLICQ
jgi:hypothetical protein